MFENAPDFWTYCRLGHRLPPITARGPDETSGMQSYPRSTPHTMMEYHQSQHRIIHEGTFPSQYGDDNQGSTSSAAHSNAPIWSSSSSTALPGGPAYYNYEWNHGHPNQLPTFPTLAQSSTSQTEPNPGAIADEHHAPELHAQNGLQRDQSFDPFGLWTEPSSSTPTSTSTHRESINELRHGPDIPSAPQVSSEIFPQTNGPPNMLNAMTVNEYLGSLHRHMLGQGQVEIPSVSTRISYSCSRKRRSTVPGQRARDTARRAWLSDRLSLVGDTVQAALLDSSNSKTLSLVARLPPRSTPPGTTSFDNEALRHSEWQVSLLAADFDLFRDSGASPWSQSLQRVPASFTYSQRPALVSRVFLWIDTIITECHCLSEARMEGSSWIPFHQSSWIPFHQ